MKAKQFQPRTDSSKYAVNSITISTLTLDWEEDEGIVPQYKSPDGSWCNFYYKGRTGHRAVVRFQTFEGLERFFQEVRFNWEAR